MSEPSLLKCTAETGSECAGRVFRHFPVRTSQIRTLSSKDPLTCNHNVNDNYDLYLFLPDETFLIDHSKYINYNLPLNLIVD